MGGPLFLSRCVTVADAHQLGETRCARRGELQTEEELDGIGHHILAIVERARQLNSFLEEGLFDARVAEILCTLAAPCLMIFLLGEFQKPPEDKRERSAVF